MLLKIQALEYRVKRVFYLHPYVNWMTTVHFLKKRILHIQGKILVQTSANETDTKQDILSYLSI